MVPPARYGVCDGQVPRQSKLHAFGATPGSHWLPRITDRMTDRTSVLIGLTAADRMNNARHSTFEIVGARFKASCEHEAGPLPTVRTDLMAILFDGRSMGQFVAQNRSGLRNRAKKPRAELHTLIADDPSRERPSEAAVQAKRERFGQVRDAPL